MTRVSLRIPRFSAPRRLLHEGQSLSSHHDPTAARRRRDPGTPLRPGVGLGRGPGPRTRRSGHAFRRAGVLGLRLSTNLPRRIGKVGADLFASNRAAAQPGLSARLIGRSPMPVTFRTRRGREVAPSPPESGLQTSVSSERPTRDADGSPLGDDGYPREASTPSPPNRGHSSSTPSSPPSRAERSSRSSRSERRRGRTAGFRDPERQFTRGPEGGSGHHQPG